MDLNNAKLAAIDPEALQFAVRTLAEMDGTDFLLDLPGVWEIVSEYYNNDAIRLITKGTYYD